jgi:hypothetical protein
VTFNVYDGTWAGIILVNVINPDLASILNGPFGATDNLSENINIRINIDKNYIDTCLNQTSLGPAFVLR